MPLPHPEGAEIAPEKLQGYLLSSSHAVGRFEAAFFRWFDFTAGEWVELERCLREIARTGDVVTAPPSAYGQKYLVTGRLRGPTGREAMLTTVWIVPTGETAPRFVTAYPSH